MVFRNAELLLVSETQIKSVNTKRLFVLSHNDDVDLS
jgi:hypothetical protein